MSQLLEERIRRLKWEIEALEHKLREREEALPAHSVRPHQLQAIEALEEEIERKRRELAALERETASP